MESCVPLKELLPGQTARICHIAGQSEHVHRLAEMGLRCGMEFQMFRPGNPCILRLAGHKVCLRADELLDVLVEPAPAGALGRQGARRRFRWRRGRNHQ